MFKNWIFRVVVLSLFSGPALLISNWAAAHDHGQKGPNGGAVMVLGDEEYHAEILLDEKTNTLTVILLDKAAKGRIGIPEPKVLVNLKHEGKGVQYQLPAVPMQGDPAGMSSRFSLQNFALVHSLHHASAGAILSAKISGKSYSGKLVLGAHDHQH